MCPQQPHALSEHLVPRKITEALKIGHSDSTRSLPLSVSYYPKNDADALNSVGDLGQKQWTTKNRTQCTDL